MPYFADCRNGEGLVDMIYGFLFLKCLFTLPIFNCNELNQVVFPASCHKSVP